ncbi:MAG: acetyltransferase [Phycisphaerae bacterium]
MSESETAKRSEYEGWAIVEVMGHRRLAGYIREASIAGGAFVRIDVPDDSGIALTQLYGPGSIYAITFVTEQLARSLAKMWQPQPVRPWELPGPTNAGHAAEEIDVETPCPTDEF